MGRSAKVHKRAKKSSSAAAPKKTGGETQAAHKEQAAAAAAAKKAGLKDKAATHRRKPGTEGHVLGGADYVDIMMGGRRKAREEATKLPPPEE